MLPDSNPCFVLSRSRAAARGGQPTVVARLSRQVAETLLRQQGLHADGSQGWCAASTATRALARYASRKPFATTMRLAPRSAKIAIHSVDFPRTASTRNTNLIPSAISRIDWNVLTQIENRVCELLERQLRAALFGKDAHQRVLLFGTQCAHRHILHGTGIHPVFLEDSNLGRLARAPSSIVEGSSCADQRVRIAPSRDRGYSPLMAILT